MLAVAMGACDGLSEEATVEPTVEAKSALIEVSETKYADQIVWFGEPSVVISPKKVTVRDDGLYWEWKSSSTEYITVPVTENKYPTQDIFILVEFELTNVSDSSLYVGASNLTLIDEDGKLHEYSKEGSLAIYSGDEDHYFERHEVFRGDTFSGWAIFEITPTGFQRHLKLKFSNHAPVAFTVVPSPQVEVGSMTIGAKNYYSREELDPAEIKEWREKNCTPNPTPIPTSQLADPRDDRDVPVITREMFIGWDGCR